MCMCECMQDDYVLLNTIVDDLTSPNYSNVQPAAMDDLCNGDSQTYVNVSI
jgi:hypothetical protein